MKFEEASYYSEPVKGLAEDMRPEILDKQIEESRAALAELQRQKEIEQKASDLAALEQARQRQQDKQIAESNLSACVQMVTQSTDQLKIKAGDFHSKFQDLAKLCREVRALYDEIQHIAYDNGLKLRNATNAASQIEPTPENGVTGPQDATIRFNELLKEVGLLADVLDCYPVGMSAQEVKLFDIISDDRPNARYKPQISSKNFDYQTW